MKAARHAAFGALLVIGLIGGISPLGRMERVEPAAPRQTIHPATPAEAKGAELTRGLEQWRTELNGAQR